MTIIIGPATLVVAVYLLSAWTDLAFSTTSSTQTLPWGRASRHPRLLLMIERFSSAWAFMISQPNGNAQQVHLFRSLKLQRDKLKQYQKKVRLHSHS
jgi:hypothetical protein